MRTLRNSILSAGIFPIAFIVFSTGCSTHPSDDKIANDLRSKIAADPDIKDAPVGVTTKDGKVILTGKLKTPAAQQKLEQLARTEAGAATVDNETTVEPAPETAAASPPPPAPTPAPEPKPTNAAPPNSPEEKAPPAEKPKPQPLVIPQGTVLTVKTSQALSSGKSQEGQTFLGTLAQPVSVGNKRALPSGATVTGRVISSKQQGRIKGEGELVLELASIAVGGKVYPIHTNTLDSTVKGKGKRTATTTGGGAAAGALIGGIAGGGKGAGIGALAGAGAGLVGGVLTGNKQVEVPAESVLTFTLASPLTIEPGHKQGG